MEDMELALTFKKLEGNELSTFLGDIRTLRVDFWEEMSKNISHLEEFEEKNPKAFCLLSEYGYLLGKFDSISLPELSTYDSTEVPIGFISELFVKKQYRSLGIGKALINSIQELIGYKQDLPLILGCDNKLVTFYKLCNFVPISNYPAKDTSLMLWCPYLETVVDRFEKLFLSPNQN